MLRVFGPVSFCTSADVPTCRMRARQMAIASASGWSLSTVQTLPLVKMRSATAGSAVGVIGITNTRVMRFIEGSHTSPTRKRGIDAFPCLRVGLVCRSLFLGELPSLIEEAGGHNLAGGARGHRAIDVDHGEVRQLWHLAGVVQVVVLAEREAAVDDDVLLRIERIRVDQDGHMMRGVEALRPELQAVA